MKIAVIGAGAMGSLYGGYLSRKNDVTLIDTNAAVVAHVAENGLDIREKDGSDLHVTPKATADANTIGEVDLVVVFVKALFTRAALSADKCLFGPNTYVLTLQNGAGHEAVLKEFVDEDHIIIGTTQHNGSILGMGHIAHGGSGLTCIGSLTGRNDALAPVAEAFRVSGFEVEISDNIQKLIWHKLFTNVSASALTGVLQVKLGFMQDDAHAAILCERLVREAVAVANGDGMGFDADVILGEVKQVLHNAHDGYTSIYADLRDGRRSEVDTISGAVVAASHRNGVPAPTHEVIVELVHALEDKAVYEK